MKKWFRFLLVGVGVLLLGGNSWAGNLSASARVSPYTKLLWDRLQGTAFEVPDWQRLGLRKAANGLVVTLFVAKQPGGAFRREIEALGGSV